MRKKKLAAYTFIEIIAVMAIIAVVFTISVPFSLKQLQSRRVESVASDISSEIYLSQQNAHSGKDANNYGISFTSTSYTIFKWEDSNPIEEIATVELPDNVEISVINLTDTSSEIIFESGNFRPSTDGILEVTDGGVTFIIRVNTEGLIEYYES